MSENRASGPVALALAALGAALFVLALQIRLTAHETYVDSLLRFAGTAWGLALTVAAIEWNLNRG
jgi:hypothetical protein